MKTFPDYDPYQMGDTVDPPKRGKRSDAPTPEWKIQASCVTYYRKRCRVDKHLRETTRLFASMNEGQRTPQRAAIAKMMGMIPGAPWDLVFMRKWPSGACQTFWIEIKRQDGKLSPAQKEWAMWLGGTGVETRVVKKLDEFIAILEAR